jgi:hypothetical protein
MCKYAFKYVNCLTKKNSLANNVTGFYSSVNFFINNRVNRKAAIAFELHDKYVE